ncbi:DUF3750 domain-containing protein [Sneathiella sp.]|uniref:DUF3750 domain-containing protein n=1 Tax=Sneathiella sp. TaxID=1964365 RepID=UPI0035676F27
MLKSVRNILILILCVLTPFVVPQMLSYAAGPGTGAADWSSARRDTAKLSPAPEDYPGAVIQVFGARTWSWRGNFAIHTWISMKKSGAYDYHRYEVIGWRAYRGGEALTHRRGSPDNYWFGNLPELLAEVKGEAAEHLITKIEGVIEAYPHKYDYRLWPGPNSNSFIAHIGREVPELALDLPPTAIGKDYIGSGIVTAHAVSGRGFQLSLGGYGGFTLSPVEGAELHLLGLTIGFDFDDVALKLPGFGRIPIF